MAIDFLIFAVLLLSFITNFLALAAFWVTPGLRTTANRFTINLLIINLVGCLILAPTLFLSGSIVSDGDSESGNNESSLSTGSSRSGLSFLTTNANDDSIEFYSKAGNHQMTIRHNGKLVEQEGIILRRNVSSENSDGENGPRTIETIYKCNSTYCRELTIDENSETLVITEIEEEGRIHIPDMPGQLDTNEVKRLALPLFTMRSWAIDMAAALGAMGVLLVVGDTWCAVTDPLRYHSRISSIKSWVLIAITWAMGILFGALSAFREIDFESETIISKQKRYAEANTTFFSLDSVNNIFSMVFSCLYFLLIILLPFGFVCGMYWRIFSEARENGLRMRQNGSSPLLQSALNLTHSSQVGNQQFANSLCVHRNSVSSTSSQCGGLQMQIDSNQKRGSPACLRRDSAAKVLLPPISDDGLSDEADNASLNDQFIVIPTQDATINQPLQHQQQQQQQQNIILTLQTASGEIKRNYSTRQLELLATSSQDLLENNRLRGMRQVHSSPNLHRSVTLPQPLNENTCSPHLLGGHLPQNLPSIHMNRHSFQQNPNNNRTAHQNHQHLHHHQSLQIPTIHASPKALSYMSSLRHRLSNASSLFKYRDESRAARISILVVIMFLVSYLPFGFLVLLQSRVPAANFEESSQLAIFMILLANLSSPFIFAYRNKRVRRGAKRLLGLNALCRDSQLQRQNSSSCRMSGSRCGNTNLKRNSSRVSTYSTNSAKYLTPQSSLVSNGTTTIGYASNNNNNCNTMPLRPNSSCSTIINFSLNKNQQNYEKSFMETDEVRTDQHSGTNKKLRPVLQRGITIIEQMPLNNCSSNAVAVTAAANNIGNSVSIHSNRKTNNTPKLPVKHKLYKLFFKSSKNLSCAAATAATHSCAQGSLDAEPTEV